MRVVVNYLRSRTAAKDVVAGIEAAGGWAVAVLADVREAAPVEGMIEQVQAELVHGQPGSRGGVNARLTVKCAADP